MTKATEELLLDIVAATILACVALFAFDVYEFREFICASFPILC